MGKKDTVEGEVGHGVWGRRTRRKGKTVKGEERRRRGKGTDQL